MSAATLPTPSARSWQASLPELYARAVPAQVVTRLDALSASVRGAVIDKLDRALDAGVCDEPTLTTIVEVVVTDRTG